MNKKLDLSLWVLKYNWKNTKIKTLINPFKLKRIVSDFIMIICLYVSAIVAFVFVYVLGVLVYPLDAIANILSAFIIRPITAFFQYERYDKLRKTLHREK